MGHLLYSSSRELNARVSLVLVYSKFFLLFAMGETRQDHDVFCMRCLVVGLECKLSHTLTAGNY